MASALRSPLFLAALARSVHAVSIHPRLSFRQQQDQGKHVALDFGDEDPESAASTADLSEAGYQALVASGNTEDMGVFARRVVVQEGLEILDEGALSGMLPYYSGECKVQSYADLVEEVHSATIADKCHGQWTRIPEAPSPLPVPAEDATEGSPQQTPAPSEQSVGPVDGVNLASGVHHILSASQERALAWREVQTDVVGYMQQKDSADGLPHIGESASLDDHGYRQVRDEHSTLEMGLFIRRVLRKHGLVADETALQYCVPWYSGECESKTYSFLIKELHEGITRPDHCGGPWVERVHQTARK